MTALRQPERQLDPPAEPRIPCIDCETPHPWDALDVKGRCQRCWERSQPLQVGQVFEDAAGAQWVLDSVIRGRMVALRHRTDVEREPVVMRWDEYLDVLRGLEASS